jgi:hypothetical protein
VRPELARQGEVVRDVEERNAVPDAEALHQVEARLSSRQRRWQHTSTYSA